MTLSPDRRAELLRRIERDKPVGGFEPCSNPVWGLDIPVAEMTAENSRPCGCTERRWIPMEFPCDEYPDGAKDGWECVDCGAFEEYEGSDE